MFLGAFMTTSESTMPSQPPWALNLWDAQPWQPSPMCSAPSAFYFSRHYGHEMDSALPSMHAMGGRASIDAWHGLRASIFESGLKSTLPGTRSWCPNPWG